VNLQVDKLDAKVDQLMGGVAELKVMMARLLEKKLVA
jgi:hypothetical protein